MMHHCTNHCTYTGGPVSNITLWIDSQLVHPWLYGWLSRFLPGRLNHWLYRFCVRTAVHCDPPLTTSA